MSLVVLLHIAGAIFLIGPLTAVTSISPRFIRSGRPGLPALELLHDATRYGTYASVVVLLLGLWLGTMGKNHLGDVWITVSITLFLVALGLLLGLVMRDQSTAIRRIRNDEIASVQAGRVAGVSAAVALLWLVILVLMIYQPGAPAGS